MTVPTLNPGGVSLAQLLAGDMAGGAATPRGAEPLAKSCTSDWRQVRRGDVFVALAGAEDDGHDHAVEAVSRGAAAVVCERQLPIFNVPQFMVADSRAAFGRLCQALVGNPSRQMKVIGVTGTSGKTTVARLLTSIFREAGTTAASLDTLSQTGDLGAAPPAVLSPPLVARSLAEMAADGVAHAVVEISSRELMQSVMAGVRLDAACVTNVRRDHLDWHGSVLNYRRAKERIFQHLDPHGVVILNADDPVCVEMLSSLDQPALTIGLRQPAEITAEIIEQQANEQTFVLSAGDDSIGVRTTIVGDHHVYNCLSAAAMCLAYGVKLTTVARGLEAVDRLPGRMERVVCGQQFPVFVDAAHSPDSLRACLRAARPFTRGRLICVFGAFGQQEIMERPSLGRVAGAMADLAFVTSSDPRGEDPAAICEQIRSGFADPRKASVVVDRSEAIAAAIREAREGDTVVVAGLGERRHLGAHGKSAALCDVDVLRQALRDSLREVPAARLAA